MRKTFVLSIAVAVFAVACHDAVQPNGAAEQTLERGGAPAMLLNTLIAPVQRSTPLPEDVTWSFVAGPDGGATTNAATGLTFVVPAGAVAEDVTITVTALAGDAVAYRFQPHGVVFARSATFTQDLRLTTANVVSGLTLSGAYFATDALEFSPTGLVSVTETIGAVVNPLTRTATFPVRHFSGYILASGRAESDSTQSEQ